MTATLEKPQQDLPATYREVRARTLALAAPLSDEDCALQSMPDASPVKWHLGHTSWFFETFVLEKAEPGFAPHHPAFRELFNSYYVAVGPRHPRPERGLLSRPSLAEVRAYRAAVDARMSRLLVQPPERWRAVAALVELGLQHEQQHQELIVTDLKHLLSRNPLDPAYDARCATLAGGTPPGAPGWIRIPEGVHRIGWEGSAFCFDNEQPAHRVFVGRVEVADRLATNGDWIRFIADGGYERPELWLSEGWDAKTARGWRMPEYWQEEAAGDYRVFTLGGLRALAMEEPVTHVSYYEADAYARWAQARLPTEFEWEVAATGDALDGEFADSGRMHPSRARRAGEFFGNAWQWTSSSYAPYPGFRAAPGAVGEYNGKFMVNQYVLRGGSCATPRDHLRATYRNFFPAGTRWQFSGVRLARDVR